MSIPYLYITSQYWQTDIIYNIETMKMNMRPELNLIMLFHMYFLLIEASSTTLLHIPQYIFKSENHYYYEYEAFKFLFNIELNCFTLMFNVHVINGIKYNFFMTEICFDICNNMYLLDLLTTIFIL